MTDTEQKRINAICKVANVDDISDLSDGYHTFRQLYYQRMMLFAAIVKQNHDKAWKSLRHADGELCFGGGWFIVGIDTPEGSYTYHYEDTYFGLFECEELEKGKTWDGHTEKDVTRLLSIEQQSCDNAISRKKVIDTIYRECSGENLDIDFAKVLLLQRAIKALPPVTPKSETITEFADRCRECGAKYGKLLRQKSGKWIEHFDESGKWYECDQCHTDWGGSVNYCPTCGAKMQVVEE